MAVASSGTGTPQVTIQWTGVNEATSYSLYRGMTSSVTTTLATGLTGTSYTDAAVVSGTTYIMWFADRTLLDRGRHRGDLRDARGRNAVNE